MNVNRLMETLSKILSEKNDAKVVIKVKERKENEEV